MIAYQHTFYWLLECSFWLTYIEEMEVYDLLVMWKSKVISVNIFLVASWMSSNDSAWETLTHYRTISAILQTVFVISSGWKPAFLHSSEYNSISAICLQAAAHKKVKVRNKQIITHCSRLKLRCHFYLKHVNNRRLIRHAEDVKVRRFIREILSKGKASNHLWPIGMLKDVVTVGLEGKMSFFTFHVSFQRPGDRLVAAHLLSIENYPWLWTQVDVRSQAQRYYGAISTCKSAKVPKSFAHQGPT